MFHDRHELDGVVPQSLDPLQDVVRELGVSPNTELRGRYSDMSFINTETIDFRRAFVLELVFLRWVPESCVVSGRDSQVLRDALDPDWKAFDPLPGWDDH